MATAIFWILIGREILVSFLNRAMCKAIKDFYLGDLVIGFSIVQHSMQAVESLFARCKRLYKLLKAGENGERCN